MPGQRRGCHVRPATPAISGGCYSLQLYHTPPPTGSQPNESAADVHAACSDCMHQQGFSWEVQERLAHLPLHGVVEPLHQLQARAVLSAPLHSIMSLITQPTSRDSSCSTISCILCFAEAIQNARARYQGKEVVYGKPHAMTA